MRVRGPYKPPEERRDNKIAFNVTSQEHRAFKQAATQDRLNLSDWIRSRLRPAVEKELGDGEPPEGGWHADCVLPPGPAREEAYRKILSQLRPPTGTQE